MENRLPFGQLGSKGFLLNILALAWSRERGSNEFGKNDYDNRPKENEEER